MFNFKPDQPDKVDYRIKVYRLLIGNPEKYPEFNAFLNRERQLGLALFTIVHLAQLLDQHFAENLTIAESAKQVEEITILGKKKAEQMAAELIAEITEGETKH